MPYLEDSITARVSEMLLTGDENLPATELQISQKLRIGRSNVRDALRDLEMQGVITRKKGKGIALREPELKEIAAVYDFRILVEGQAGFEAAGTATEDDIRELERINEEFLPTLTEDGVEARLKQESLFHGTIVKLAGNPFMYRCWLSSDLLVRCYRKAHKAYVGLKMKTPGPDDNVCYRWHERILEALRNGDGEESRRLLTLHIQNARQRVVEHITGIKLGGIVPYDH